ncbi:MAG: winged helix-turn-helix domain-containing protein [Methanomassiliicoccales archaeon]|nr:winged helix-turn-helix domain-containing protein [Methanomassiliicoccales archaeon]
MPSERGMERPDIFVVARIMERLWREGRPMLKTRLQLATRLNYDVLVKYLEWMRGRGLISYESDGGHETVVLSERGEKVYVDLAKLLGQLLDDGWR